MKRILVLTAILLSAIPFAQDTTLVQTLTFDSIARAYTFQFPDGSETYRKVLMRYRMRCKGALISTGSNTNLGCGEWDYSCNTFITDSTRTDSVKAIHPNYIISGFSGTPFNYTANQTYTYYSFDQVNTVNTNPTSENSITIDNGIIQNASPLSTEFKSSKSQYLFTAAELAGAGLIGGNDITSLKLDIAVAADNVNHLKFKLKNTTKTELNDSTLIDDNGFTEVYYQNTNIINGLNEISFNTAYNWDGTSNIIVEVSFTNSVNGTSSEDLSMTTAYNSVIESHNDDSYLKFTAGDNYAELNNTIDFGSTQDFTIELWVKPGQNQNDPSILSDKNWASGINKGYLLFQNGNTWAINVGDGANRLDLIGGNITTDGKWHHIAVSFDRDGLIRLYQDGVQINSGNLLAASMGNIFSGNTLKFGQDGTGSYGIDWVGEMDDVRIWNRVLTADEINNWQYKNISNTHPSFSDLIVNQTFNSLTLGQLVDESTNGNNAVLQNSAEHKLFRGDVIFKGFDLSQNRPNLTFIQGIYGSSLNSTSSVLDSIANPSNVVTEYQVVGGNIIEVSTNNYYEAGNMSIFDEAGNEIEIVNVPVQNTISITDLAYYNKFPSKFEIMSFVTPYGIGLDLGPNGKMWEFDMTGFTPILTNDKLLTVEFSGAYQEELDIQFLFISGTPDRTVIDIQNIWKPGVRRSYTSLISERYFEPRTVQLDPLSEMYKVRNVITGHGQEGEFIPRTHYLDINGGANELEWQVWKICGENPVFPQGGTWVYDRAGWCPGMATDLKTYEIDPAAVTNNTINVDYGVTAGSGTSDYYISSQLVQYSSPNFINDASVVDIINPGLKTEHGRVNPSCINPLITIQNTGSIDLTALKIEYKVLGGTTETMNWTGNLSFLKTEQVELPISGIGFWAGGISDVMEVTVSNPNGTTDENNDNNRLTSQFELPDWYGENFYIELKTNNNPNENSYVIKDFQDGIVFTKSGLSANTTYKDTLTLAGGCYTLEMTDSGQNGLAWWAATAQGTGAIKLRSTSSVFEIFKTFEPDFGSGFKYGFTIGAPVSVVEQELNQLQVVLYPNPASSQVNISLEGITSKSCSIKVIDVLGKVHYTRTIDTSNNMSYNSTINTRDLTNGSYFVEINSDDKKEIRKLMVNN